MTSAENILPEIVQGYLDANRAVPASPLPATAALPIHVGLETAPRPRPVVVVHVPSVEYPHPKICKATLAIELLTQGDDTPRATLTEWLSSIRCLMVDADTWNPWLLALPAADLAGWNLLKIRHLGSEVELEPGERARGHVLAFQVWLRHCETEDAD